MLNDWAISVLNANRIDPNEVEEVHGDMIVKFKNGEEKRLCEIWQRVMGYLRPTTEFNKGKYSEFVTRKYFNEPEGGPDDAA